MLEAAWAPLSGEVNQARRALAGRVPGVDGDFSLVSVIDGALEEFLHNEQTLADRERVLGHDHLLTRTVRGNLQSAG